MISLGELSIGFERCIETLMRSVRRFGDLESSSFALIGNIDKSRLSDHERVDLLSLTVGRLGAIVGVPLAGVFDRESVRTDQIVSARNAAALVL
jgi:hypothetical protein